MKAVAVVAEPITHNTRWDGREGEGYRQFYDYVVLIVNVFVLICIACLCIQCRFTTVARCVMIKYKGSICCYTHSYTVLK
jgi:hypothetical protein